MALFTCRVPAAETFVVLVDEPMGAVFTPPLVSSSYRFDSELLCAVAEPGPAVLPVFMSSLAVLRFYLLNAGVIYYGGRCCCLLLIDWDMF